MLVIKVESQIESITLMLLSAGGSRLISWKNVFPVLRSVVFILMFLTTEKICRIDWEPFLKLFIKVFKEQPVWYKGTFDLIFNLSMWKAACNLT